jgi:hypothetical protein
VVEETRRELKEAEATLASLEAKIQQFTITPTDTGEAGETGSGEDPESPASPPENPAG